MALDQYLTRRLCNECGMNVSKGWLSDPYNLSLEQVLELYSQAKVKVVEFQAVNLKIFDTMGNLNKEMKRNVLDTLSSFDFCYIYHSPYPGYAPVYLDENYGKPHERIIDILDAGFEICVEIDSPVAIVHPSHKVRHDWEVRVEEKLISRIYASLKDAIAMVEKYDMPLLVGVENMPPKISVKRIGTLPEEILEIIKGLDSPYVGTVWDFGHATISHTLMKIPYEKFIGEFADMCIHVHVHSNYGLSGALDERKDYKDKKGDLHLPVGFGVTPVEDFIRVLARKGYRGSFILESGPDSFMHTYGELDFIEWIKRSYNDLKELVDNHFR